MILSLHKWSDWGNFGIELTLISALSLTIWI
jgi:hypothetical protein